MYLASAAKAISYCGDFLAATTLALALQARGDNGYGVAALLMAAALPMAILGPLGGRLADRVDSRALLVTTGPGQAVVCALLASTDHPAAIVALVAVLSAGLAVTQPTLSALVPDMVGPENLPKAMSISQTAGALGMLAGPALGGVLVGTYGVRLPLWLDAASFLALVAAGLSIRTRRGGRVTPPASAAPTTTDSPWRLRGDRLLVTLLVAVASVIAAVTAVHVVEVFFVRDTLGAPESMYGALETVWTLGVLAGAWPFGRVRGGDHGFVITMLLALTGLSLVVLVSAGVPTAGWLLPLYLGGGALNAGLNVLSGVVLGRRVPAAVRGRVFGTFAGVCNAANMIGYAVGGALMPLAPPRAIIAGTGIAGLLVGAAFLVPLVASLARKRIAAESAAAVGYRAET